MKTNLKMLLLAIAAMVSIVLGIGIGSVSIHPTETAAIIFSRL